MEMMSYTLSAPKLKKIPETLYDLAKISDY